MFYREKKVNRRAATVGGCWVFDAGLKRPAYHQGPLRGSFISRSEVLRVARGFMILLKNSLFCH
jgi:hypothetical protein